MGRVPGVHVPVRRRDVHDPAAQGVLRRGGEATATSYQRVFQTTRQMKACLAAGFPFVFGFTVLSSFESDEVAKTGVMPMPQDDDECLGGHAVCCVGYDDEKQVFIVRNSWGDEWGDGGYFYMPYEYISNSNLASDFWTIRWVE